MKFDVRAIAIAALLSHAVAALSLVPREDCNTSADWQLNSSAWIRANADINFRKWWAGRSSKPHQSVPWELGEAFADHHPYECGLLDDSSCTVAGCKEFQRAGDPPWAYMAQISMVNLHELFGAIYIDQEGITYGQLDFTDSLDEMALTFFPWKEPNFAAADVVIWMSWLLNVFVIFVPVLAPVGISVRAATGLAGLASLATAGMNQAVNQLQSRPQTSFNTLADLKNLTADYSEKARRVIDKWATATFSGEGDNQNLTIIDYFAGGTFVNHSILPAAPDVETFYTKQMVSMVINSQWRKGKIFTTFFRTNDTNDTSGPNATRYYSGKDGGVYYTYLYHEDGRLKGHLDKPWGLDKLNESSYGISGNDITKASAGAWNIGGLNFTREMAYDLLQKAISSNGTLNPWRDGAGWPGTWSLPVCDMGTYNWNTQFGEKRGKYGMLPCCCGPNCRDTKAFVQAANMKKFKTLLRGCEKQLNNSGIDFKTIDYGFK